jgi:uncharacterized protein (TIGR00730 family)
MTMSKTPRKPSKPRSLPQSRTKAEWSEHWQRQPVTVELPPSATRDRAFLTQTRTPKKESERIKRVNEEFKRATRALFETGPAVTVFGSARFKPSHPYYKLARAVGRELAKAGFATLTGGGPGVMEAANRGAHEAGGASLGLNIVLPHEQAANPYVDKSIEFEYFFTRKTCLVKYSCAYIVMPGGLGTLDELFEAATLVQCGKIGPFPVILMGEAFWRGMREWGQEMMQEGVFTREEVQFGHFTDSPKAAVEFILASLTEEVRAALKPAASPKKRPAPVKKAKTSKKRA